MRFFPGETPPVPGRPHFFPGENANSTGETSFFPGEETVFPGRPEVLTGEKEILTGQIRHPTPRPGEARGKVGGGVRKYGRFQEGSFGEKPSLSAIRKAGQREFSVNPTCGSSRMPKCEDRPP